MASLAGKGKYAPRKPMNTSTIAMMSIVGMIGGAWLTFRFLAPRPGTFVTTNEEMEAFRGSDNLQTDVGNKTARPPRKGYSVPRGSV